MNNQHKTIDHCFALCAAMAFFFSFVFCACSNDENIAEGGGEDDVVFVDDNRVGGKRSSFLPTFVFRPLTPPYVRFRIRRFLFWIPFEIRFH